MPKTKTTCELCNGPADLGVCGPCHLARCKALGLDPRTGGPAYLPSEPEWKARLRLAGHGKANAT